ncbi:MAG: ribonuclease P [Candidatus Aenigmarchaeota archaeon]|nr:ribonuclease P [Candidatus Aenigmarchaeota archaeon]
MKKPDWQQDIAKERIGILLALAEKEFRKNPSLAQRYVELARKISLRYNVRMRKEQKRKFCKKCNCLLLPGATSTVRLDSKRKLLIIKCKNCNTIYRQPYKLRK